MAAIAAAHTMTVSAAIARSLRRNEPAIACTRVPACPLSALPATQAAYLGRRGRCAGENRGSPGGTGEGERRDSRRRARIRNTLDRERPNGFQRLRDERLGRSVAP